MTNNGWSNGYYGAGKSELLPGVESPAPRPVSSKPKADMEDDTPSLKKQIQDFAENTCTNGVPNIPRAQHILRKIFWIVVVASFTGVTIWQIYTMVDKFYKYPVNVNVNVTYDNALTFPSITICNINPVRRSMLATAGPSIQTLLPNSAGTPGGKIKTDNRFNTRNDFIHALAHLPQDTRKKIGHQPENMIVSCYYDQVECTAANFTTLFNYLYGNCFTFNGGMDTLTTHKSGPHYGLEVILFLEQDEYVPELTEGVGARIEIFHQGETPFPEDKGLLIPPGYQTEISLRMVNITRLPAPFPSNCWKMTHEEAKSVNMYADHLPVTYSELACQKTCFQKKLIEQCSCGDEIYPLEAHSLPLINGTGPKPCLSADDLICEDKIYALYTSDLLDCNCSKSCQDIVYEVTPSMAKWPNRMYEQTLYDELAGENTAINSSRQQGHIGDNILKLHIFYEELNYEAILESEGYGLATMASDLGGIVGLYLGLSIVAIFEILELIFDLILVSCMKLYYKNKKQSNVTPHEKPVNNTVTSSVA